MIFPESYGSVDRVIFEGNTDLDNVYFALEEETTPQMTSKQLIEELLGGMEEDLESEFIESNVDSDGPLSHPKKPSESPLKKEKEGTSGRKTSEKIPNNAKTSQKARIDPKKEAKMKIATDFFEQVMEMVDLITDEQTTLRSFKELDEHELENLKKDLREYMKDFPEFEEYLENAEKDPELLLDLLDELEEKYPEIKAVFKDSLMKSKQKKGEKGDEEKKRL